MCGGEGVEGGGYIIYLWGVKGGGYIIYLWGGQGGRLHFVGRGVKGVLWGGGGIKGEVSNCTVKQATQQGCLKNQQSKVQSVLPTVMANSSMASHRGGECPGGPDRYFSG